MVFLFLVAALATCGTALFSLVRLVLVTVYALIHGCFSLQVAFIFQTFNAACGFWKQVMTKLAISKRVLVFLVGKGHDSKPPTFKHYVASTHVFGSNGYDKRYAQHYKDCD